MNSTNIRIKARFNEDIRRFQCQANWTVLSETLHALFSFPPNDSVKITYQDDENDLCSISSQMELDAAIMQFPVLHLIISKPTNDQTRLSIVPVSSSPWLRCIQSRLSTINLALQNPNLPPMCAERLTQKKIKFEVRLEAVQKNQCSVDSAQPHQRPAHCGPEARLAFISKILEQADLSPEKVQKLTRKKEKLQQRLKQKSESTVSEEPKICHPRPHGHCARRWNERPTKTEETDWTNNCGFFGFGPFAKLEMIQNLLENPDLSPEKRERLMHKKEILQNRIEERQNHCEQKCFRRCQRNAQPEDDLPPCRRLNRGRK
jgi:hypothetical protein